MLALSSAPKIHLLGLESDTVIMRGKRMEISGWGRYPRGCTNVLRPERVKEAVPPSDGPMIPRGQGRSYGNAAMFTGGSVMLTERLNKFLSFDQATGVLRAEAGATIADVLDTFVPRGWFPAVTPGTKFVSLGGCVAADVHGKNHHRVGTLGNHVAGIEVVLANGERRRCSPQQDSELFWATVGGMGLTGIITEVSLQLIPIETAYVVVQRHTARNLEESLALFEEGQSDDEYSVAWLDCVARGTKFGRSILTRGHHAKISDLPSGIEKPLEPKPSRQRSVPFGFPSWFLNPLSISLFNRLYYFGQSGRKKPFVTTCESYFYPLDQLGNWNRLYGKRGFIQYQCVVPSAQARRGLQLVLEEVARSGRGSFLSVLKRMGGEGPGLLSFPIEGYTLSLDLPVSDPGLFPFLDRLDEIVVAHGGRVYLAKDTRVNPPTFQKMYPRFAEWRRIKAKIDPGNRFDSDLARMLAMGAPA